MSLAAQSAPFPPRAIKERELSGDPDNDFVRHDCCAFVAWFSRHCTQRERWVEKVTLAIIFNEYASQLDNTSEGRRNEVICLLVRLAAAGYIKMKTRDAQVYIEPKLVIAIRDALYRAPPQPSPQPS